MTFVSFALVQQEVCLQKIESIWLCILLACSRRLRALNCLYCGTSASPEEEGPNQHANTASSTVQSTEPVLGHGKQKEAPVLTRREAVFLEVVLLFLLPPRTSRQKQPESQEHQ